ncbi:hypothetical protein BDQ17DRAFT_1388378 [Cyathus striatus]|nr:hypothetical protein BDQ17DRAFT_1388378 [Cyathus striatus]
MAEISKWAAGTSYGPVLSQTDLYLLKTPLEIHPIFAGTAPDFTLAYSLAEGRAGGFNAHERDRDLALTAKDEPATLPRVQKLIIITRCSPWCTTVENERGVTLQDVLTGLWTDYGEAYVSEAEFQSLNPRLQETVRRVATSNIAATQGWNAYHQMQMIPPNQIRRADWLRDRRYFQNLVYDPNYITSRLGFHAPNTFVLELMA